MKIARISGRLALPLALIATLAPSQAQPGKTEKPARLGPAVKHAQDVLGKPLSPAQKKAVRAAQKQRADAIKPIQAKFRADVAKALGLSAADYEAREKALRQKKAQKR